MEKNYSILKKYILYFLVFALVCLVGISNIFALTNNNSINFYDNNGSSLTAVTTGYIQQTDESSATFTTTANSYGGAVMIQASSSLVQGHLYTLFINVAAANMGGMTELSTKNCVGLGSTYANAINSYVNCSITPKYSQKSGVTFEKGNGLYYTFIANTNGAYILIPYTSHETCYNCYQYSYGFNLEDGGDTTGLTQQQVNNLISQQTTTIQNEINQMQQDISGSIDNMKNSINDNIDKNLNNCFTNKNVEDYEIGTITSNGSNFPNSYRLRTNFITILPSNEYKLTLTSNYTMQIVVFEYDSNKKFIKRQPPGWGSVPFTFTTSEDTKYIRVIFRTNPEQIVFGNEITDLVIEGSFCDNKLDEANETSKGILGKIKEFFNFFNNDNINENDIDTYFDDFNDFLDDNSTITQLITLPVTLYTAILNNLNGSCSPFNLGKLFGTDLIIPCINISQYLGNSLWTMIDIIISGFAIFAISKKFIKVFNNLSSLKEGDVIDD